VIAPHQ